MKKLLARVKQNYSPIILFLLCLAYFLFFSWFTLQRYYNFFPMRYDLGNMVQTVWNTSQGNIFVMTHPETNQNVSRFSVHGDFFLIFLAPIYKLFPTPEALLMIQVLLIAMSGIPLYLIARNLLNNKWLPLIIVFAFFMNPSLQRSNIYEFHAVTVVPLFIFSSFYFLLCNKWLWFFVFAFLACSTKEQVPLIYFWLGLYTLFIQKNWKIGLLTIALSISWFFMMISYVIPHFREGLDHFGLRFYEELGESPTSVIKGFFTNPSHIWKTVTDSRHLLYLKQILLPFGFLPLFSPFILLSSSELMINLLSSYTPMQTINYQYTGVITPLLLISVVYFFKFIIKFNKYFIYLVTCYLLLVTVISSYLYGPLIYAKTPNLDAFKPKFSYTIDYKYINTLIPSSASLSVTNNLGAHFANHKYLYTFSSHYQSADYTLILIEDAYEAEKKDKLMEYVNILQTDGKHSLIYNKGKLYLFKKTN